MRTHIIISLVPNNDTLFVQVLHEIKEPTLNTSGIARSAAILLIGDTLKLKKKSLRSSNLRLNP